MSSAVAEAGLTRNTAARAGLDPRTKVVLVFSVSATVMSPAGLVFIPAALLLAVGLAIAERAWSRAAGIVIVAVAMWVLGWILPLWLSGPFIAVVSVTASYMIRFVAAFGIGMHLFATTSPTGLNAALRAWRVPRPIAVTLAVMLRFFPVVASEASAVPDAMRLRGLVGVRGITRHPILSIERFTVPMIAASLRASEDLSASAILRGLGSRRRPSSMNPPQLGAIDLILVVAVAALAALSLTLPSPLT